PASAGGPRRRAHRRPPGHGAVGGWRGRGARPPRPPPEPAGATTGLTGRPGPPWGPRRAAASQEAATDVRPSRKQCGEYGWETTDTVVPTHRTISRPWPEQYRTTFE